VAPSSIRPYSWPLKPFDKQHPVRGYFNDPREGEKSRAFHFGIDISCKDGTPVYAVEAGTVHLGGGRSLAVVSTRGGRTFGYWHVVPAVKHHQAVRQGQLLGRTEAPWGHLHFAESSRKQYRNPLRPGALTPWSDPSSPRIVAIELFQAGTRKKLPPAEVWGPVDVVVEAYDIPPLPVPPPWANMPVTPALLRWRVLRGNEVVRPWRAPVDFRSTMLPASRYSAIYAPGTHQNHPNQPGRYRFFLAHDWSTRLLRKAQHRLEVEASDCSGNKARAGLAFTVQLPPV
jgi:Peptidase family M23